VFTSCEYNLRFTTRSLYDNPSYTLSSFYILLTSAIMYAAQLRTTLPCECVAFNVQLQLRRAAAAVPVSDAVTLPVVFSPACGCVQPEHVTAASCIDDITFSICLLCCAFTEGAAGDNGGPTAVYILRMRCENVLRLLLF